METLTITNSILGMYLFMIAVLAGVSIVSYLLPKDKVTHQEDKIDNKKYIL